MTKWDDAVRGSTSHAARSLLDDETVLEQAENARAHLVASRLLRAAWAMDVERLAESGTAADLERWVYHHGSELLHDVRGSDHGWVLRRLRKCAERVGMSVDELKAMIYAGELR